MRNMDTIRNMKIKDTPNISNGSTAYTFKENIKTNYGQDFSKVDIYNKSTIDNVKIGLISVKNGLKERKKKNTVTNSRKHFYILPKKNKEAYFIE